MNHCKYCKFLDSLGLCMLTNEYRDQWDVCEKFELDETDGE